MTGLTACSNQNDIGTANPKVTAIDYIPLVVGNEWRYENTFEIQDQNPQQYEETLKVVQRDSSQINQTAGYVLHSDLPLKDRGWGSQLLVDGQLNKVRGRIIFNGKFNLIFPSTEDSLSISLRNLVILDQNMEDGGTLSFISDTIPAQLNFENTVLPVAVLATLQTIEVKKHNSFFNGINDFENVIQSALTLNLQIEISGEANPPQVLLEAQEVLQMNQYFAKDIGLVLNEAVFNMEFDDLSLYGITEAPSAQQTSTQVLTDYLLRNAPSNTP